jgi:hypothetical protein
MPNYVRVTDQDTGHKLSVLESEVEHGNYRVLKADAADHNGDPLPPEHNAVKPLSNTTEAKSAIDTTKE